MLEKKVSCAQTGSFQQLTIKKALLNGLVATEMWMWFLCAESHASMTLLTIVFECQYLTCLFLVYYLNVLGPWVIKLAFK